MSFQPHTLKNYFSSFSFHIFPALDSIDNSIRLAIYPWVMSAGAWARCTWKLFQASTQKWLGTKQKYATAQRFKIPLIAPSLSWICKISWWNRAKNLEWKVMVAITQCGTNILLLEILLNIIHIKLHKHKPCKHTARFLLKLWKNLCKQGTLKLILYSFHCKLVCGSQKSKRVHPRSLAIDVHTLSHLTQREGRSSISRLWDREIIWVYLTSLHRSFKSIQFPLEVHRREICRAMYCLAQKKANAGCELSTGATWQGIAGGLWLLALRMKECGISNLELQWNKLCEHQWSGNGTLSLDELQT